MQSFKTNSVCNSQLASCPLLAPRLWNLNEEREVVKTLCLHSWHYTHITPLGGPWALLVSPGYSRVNHSQPLLTPQRHSLTQLCFTLTGRLRDWSGKIYRNEAPNGEAGQRTVCQRNLHTELTRRLLSAFRTFRYFNFLAYKKNSAFVWLSQPQCLADCITFILMISRSPGRSWQLKTEGWPQKRKAFLFLNTKKGKLRTLPFSDERIDRTCVEKLIFMFLTVTYRACGICIIYRLACKLFSFQLATNLRSKKALITSLN